MGVSLGCRCMSSMKTMKIRPCVSVGAARCGRMMPSSLGIVGATNDASARPPTTGWNVMIF